MFSIDFEQGQADIDNNNARRVIESHLTQKQGQVNNMAIAASCEASRLTIPIKSPVRGAVVARSGVRVPGLTTSKAPMRGFPRVCYQAAAARSLQRRRCVHIPVHLCFPPTFWWGKASPEI